MTDSSSSSKSSELNRDPDEFPQMNLATNTVEELKYDSAPQRRQRMRAIIVEQGFCTSAELAAIFDVHEMTVRRDIAKMTSTDNSLRNVHGGISSVPAGQSTGSDYGLREETNRQLKAAISRRALELLPDGGTIALDSGTTTFHFARMLPVDRPLRVVTHSVPVMHLLMEAENIELTGLGGNLQRASQSFTGPMTVAAALDLQVDTFFVAASSISPRGVFCANDYDAATKRTLLDIASEAVLLADSSKFSSNSLIRMCALGAISTLITDDGITDDARAMVQAAGLTLITVPRP